MSNELATRETPLEMTREQVELLKRTICRDSTDDEFSLFMQVCKRSGLDPFARQIHAVKRWDSDIKANVMSFQVGIDGFRSLADSTGERAGDDGPYWCGADGQWMDVWLSDEPPVAAKYTVYRKGMDRPFTGVARYSEYCQTTRDGTPNRMWRTMPANQLAKCAESLALRKAFPQKLGGLYTHEEMQQADVVEEYTPKPADGVAQMGKDELQSLLFKLSGEFPAHGTKGVEARAAAYAECGLGEGAKPATLKQARQLAKALGEALEGLTMQTVDVEVEVVDE